MNIELPKDAEGREIPLDTKVLYDKEGNKREVSSYTFVPSTAFWAVEFEPINSSYYATEDFKLTPPDSWEKLEEDLDRCIKGDSLCPYYSPSGKCSTCIFDSKSPCHCDSLALEDIKKRIRKLREDE